MQRTQHTTVRCPWAAAEPNLTYHDKEWGVPVHDDRTLFEFLTLEGAQAGLSWQTILNKRENYRKAFRNFDAAAVSRITPAGIEKLMLDPGIVRNRLKIKSTVGNAKAFLKIQKEFGSFDAYVWRFVDDQRTPNRWSSFKKVHARTEESDALSKDLKRRGLRFVGTTICYAFMQAVGMVNDHVVDCFRYNQVRENVSVKSLSRRERVVRSTG
jgi:DNA-3-methyladenine glycosylase I